MPQRPSRRKQQLSEFAARWDQKYPTIAALWQRHWQRVIPFFAFPAEIRKVIYTTNAVESLNMSLRKVLKPRVAFPSEEAALKVMYLALRNLIVKWERPHTLEGLRSTASPSCGKTGFCAATGA